MHRRINYLITLHKCVALPRHQSAKLGIELAGGDESNFLHGDAGIFVASVQAGSAADGKLFPRDRILAVC